MNTARVPALALAINRCVSFQNMVGRDCLLSEHYLGQPVAEYLLHHHAGRLTPEDNHPSYKSGKTGRPRQLDYTLRHGNSSKLNIAFECKWIGKIHDNQRIINDLLRLEALAGAGESEPTCFFIVAGLLKDFEMNFRDVALNFSGSRVPFTRSLLSSPVKPKGKSKHAISVQHCHMAMRPFFRNFASDYGVSLPTRFFTRIVGRTVDDGVAVSIWQVYSQLRRATFVPSLKWA